MRLAALRALLGPAGQELLQEIMASAPREANFLRHYQTLSRRHPPDLARLALEVAILRGEAAEKFPLAPRMYFTRQALEQATTFEVSSYHAARFASYDRVADLGCSLGGDTLAIAQVSPVIGVDIDPLRLVMAGANLAAAGLAGAAHFVCADLERPLPFASPPGSMALYFDPGRRSGGRRIFSVREYQPPLEAIREWLPRWPSLGVKVSPGVDLDELGEYECELEFVSLRGELKEALLWFGPLRTARRRATLLPGGYTLSAAGPWEAEPPANLAPPGAVLYEPDPAVLRAGLVRNLAEQLHAAQLDPDIAYLTSERLEPTPFARAWDIEAWFPFNLKRLRAYLRQRNVGRVTVKKRGSPLQPEALQRDLRLKGEQERVVILTQMRGQPIVLISNRMAQGG
ncbi:MAG: class I SAM-dependent methyltransferase [Anaerolineales bacterium]|nr:class I SAM-dependent methyltransferase [Anaerolineales bacterium]